MAPKRVLLAEDNPDHQLLLEAALLRDRPFVSVHVVETRARLLEALERERFDCIVLDFNLPPYSAAEIIDQLRDTLQSTPAVVISSCLEQRVVIESMRRGVADFVPKHEAVARDTLWRSVQSAIERHTQHRMTERSAARRLRSLKRRADHDALTGLCNRGYGDRLLSSARAHRDRRTNTACVMIDLDHFKRINDTFGHACGDHVLRRVAALIKGAAAACDTVFRWGGEEFMVLRSSSTTAEAWGWAETLRRDIAALKIEFAGGDIAVTASIGLVSLPTAEIRPESVAFADRALYLAKELGRDRVCTWAMVQIYEAAETLGASAPSSWGHIAHSIIGSLSMLGGVRAEQTGPHCALVRDLAVRIACELAIPEAQARHIEAAALLHDIGKLTIPEELLAKPGPLTADERRFVDEHARFGGELCRALGAAETVAQAVARHHDRFEEPRAGPCDPAAIASIIGAADAYITMINERPYAARRSVEQALAELERERGRQFDPRVVDAIALLDGPPPRQLVA